ncbi:MAG: high-affinity branched-chain amino acid ABC transporter permease LivM, partial [Dongiaceae bacterium]
MPRSAIQEAFLAALVAAGLAIPMLGLKLAEQEGGLAVEYRWNWVIAAAAIVFMGRLALIFLRRFNFKPKIFITANPKRLQWLGWLLVAVAIGLPFLPGSSRYAVDLGTTILIYIMLGWGLSITVGLAGLLDLGYVAFYAIGAYAYALLSLHFGLSFWTALPLAGVAATLAGILVGLPVLRLRGDYLAIVTLGFGEIVRLILINWQDLTGGPNGISGIERPSFFGLPFAREGENTFHQFFNLDYSSEHRLIFLYYLILFLALAINIASQVLRKSSLGRSWEALRENEIAARSLGLNPTILKLSAFAIGAFIAGLAGAFFATRQGFISPESFTFSETAIILAIVVLGGMGSSLGVVLAALILVALPEWGREVADFRMLLFGAAMVLIM